ncbi:MAG: hypothetical protein Q4G39_03055 [Brachymonas sp.]|nr:hypothetical protein [Brachymonas sp.]
MKIALVTTFFPPANGVAVNRMHAFARYLAEKHEVVVVTLGKHDALVPADCCKNFTTCYVRNHRVMEYLRHHPADTRLIHHGKSAVNLVMARLQLSRFAMWRRRALRQLKQLHCQHPFDAIVSSYMPVDTHLLVLEFLKSYAGVIWIADMRDEMSRNPHISRCEQQRLRRVELAIDQHAMAVTSVSQPILDDFRKLMPNVLRFEQIRNGYDHDYSPPLRPFNTRFCIGYFGSFYGNRKPHTFFLALEQLCDEIDMEIHIATQSVNFDVPPALIRRVHLHGFLSYQQSVEMMATMDANLLILPKLPEFKGVFSGKIFDYISVYRPVLAVVDPDDVAADLVRELGCGYVADVDEVEQIKSMLRQAHADWLQGQIKHGSPAQVRQLHRRVQVQKLSALLCSLHDDASSGKPA